MLHVSTPDTHNHTINQHLRKHFQHLTVLGTYLFSMSSTDQAWRWSKTLASDGDICNNENMLQLETTKTSKSMWMYPCTTDNMKQVLGHSKYSDILHWILARHRWLCYHLILIPVTNPINLDKKLKWGTNQFVSLPYCQERATSTYITLLVSPGFKFV